MCEGSFAVPALAAARSLQDDNCESLNRSVSYHRRGFDIGVTVEPSGYRLCYRERVPMPQFSQIPTVGEAEPRLERSVSRRGRDNIEQ